MSAFFIVRFLTLMRYFNLEKQFLTYLFLIVFAATTVAQENVTTFGIFYKPVVPMKALDNDEITGEVNQTAFTITPKVSHSFGMVIRRGFTKSLSLETGINYITRKYDLTITDLDSSFSGTSNFRFIGYEIPLQGLVYIRLGEQLYMNASTGVSLDFYPSDIATGEPYFFHQTLRNGWIQTAFLSNVGFELRTRKSGYFYLGASFHRPFKAIAGTDVLYKGNNHNDIFSTSLNGNYFTIDLRYFFHEDPERKSKTKKKK